MDKKSRIKIALGVIAITLGIFGLLASRWIYSYANSMIWQDLDYGNVHYTSEGEKVLAIAVVFTISSVILTLGGVVTAAIGFVTAKSPTIVRPQQFHAILLLKDGQQHGPYSMTSIVEWYKSGKLSPNDWVCIQGTNDWTPITSFLRVNNPTL